MEIIGIICEYNPFHNGHLYHLNKIKELYPNSIVILVMSGYFTERGDISLISKYNKTELALKYGVDLVLEIPTVFGVNSADYFGETAIRVLNYAGVKKIVFGSECNDTQMLTKIANIQINNRNFDKQVKEELDKGLNYPTALAKTCGITLDSNDLLGVSYIKAIIRNNYDIEPITIKRTNNFNDTNSDGNIVSALNIRERLDNDEDISKYVPEYDLGVINKIDKVLLFSLLKYKIITSNDLDQYLGVDEGLSNKLKKEIEKTTCFDDLIKRIKSKRYTYVRLQRMLIHILLGIKKEDINISIDMARILGFNKKGQEYLKELKSERLINKNIGRLDELERRAVEIYYLLTKDETVLNDYLNKPIKE